MYLTKIYRYSDYKRSVEDTRTGFLTSTNYSFD